MYTCVCGKKVLHYLHYLHLFSPASVPSRTYIGIDSRLRSYRPTPIYVWGDVDIRVKRCPYTYATLIRSRLAMAIPPPLSYASLGNQTGKTRGRSTVCNLIVSSQDVLAGIRTERTIRHGNHHHRKRVAEQAHRRNLAVRERTAQLIG